MDILMFGHKRIPSREGGIEIVVEELATRMVRCGHNVTCYNRATKKDKKRGFLRSRQFRGVSLIDVPTIDKKGLAAVTSSFFSGVFSIFGKYDVVHIHAEGPAFFAFLPKLFGSKVIVTVHGLDHQRAKWGRFSSWYIRQGEKHAVRFADEIIVLSKGVQEYFQNTYGRKTVFIPNGVSLPVPVKAEEITMRWGLKKNSYILYLGRIVPEKGEHYLIEAFKKIDTDKKLVIAGGISDTAEYGKELKELAKDDTRIIFTGFVQGRILEELFSNTYVYCLPSDLEGMPLSLLEAMSYGNCCLTSDISECAEVLEDKGVTFKKSDVDDLKEKLEWLLSDKEAVFDYKSQAAEFICGKYNWDRVVDETLDLYRG